MRSTLRNSDVMMECGEHQFFLLLPEIQENDVNRVVSRVIEHWEDSFFAQDAEVSWETGRVHLRHEEND